MAKHKHCELIKQWADGAKIQISAGGEWFDNDPNWSDCNVYRIKPEEKKPVVRWLWANKFGEVLHDLYSDYEDKASGYTIKLEWSRTEFPE